MEDGAAAHQAHHIWQIREQCCIPKLQWLPASPNLPLIENVWFIQKDKLNKWHPRPLGLAGMGEAIKEEWDSISEAYFLIFVDSMPERI